MNFSGFREKIFMTNSWSKHWRRLIAINVALLVGYLIYKAIRDNPPYPYIHLLVDYHFGLTKRALIGAMISQFTTKVPVWLVFALGSAIIVITFALYLRLFRKTFGFSDATTPLFVFIAGSPFFFKSFVQTIGYFDIYGCAFAIVVLLVPARSFAFVVFAAAGSIVLLLIHHIHMLLYIPTVAAIVVMRYYLVRKAPLAERASGFAFACGIAAAFIAMQFFGNVDVSLQEFERHILSRVGAGGEKAAPLTYAYVWFRTAPEEARDTWIMLPTNLKVLPFNVALFALHIPLIRYFRDSVRALDSLLHRRLVLAAIASITLGYLAIFATVFDYPRWLSSWAVCMVLILHAVKQLPASAIVPLIAPDDKRALALAICLTFIPRLAKF
jgi:hypothetical protein